MIIFKYALSLERCYSIILQETKDLSYIIFLTMSIKNSLLAEPARLFKAIVLCLNQLLSDAPTT